MSRYVDEEMVWDEPSVNSFAIRCAKHFVGPVIKEFFPDQYSEYGDTPPSLPPHAATVIERDWESQKELTGRIDRLRAMTLEDLHIRLVKYNAERTEVHEEYRRKMAERIPAHVEFLDEVLAWSPPSADYLDLKTFMINEILDEIKELKMHSEEPLAPYDPPLEEWRDYNIRCLSEAKKNIQERARIQIPEIEKWNAWLRVLHDACGDQKPELQEDEAVAPQT